MCGIVGYVGERDAVPYLLEGLHALEYRGYDSAGVAVWVDGSLRVCRSEGRLSVLESRIAAEGLAGSPGIGHTRWATHGEPSESNAHPHMDCSRRVAVVHNGIVENYADLRRRLQADGHNFGSETDTEVIPHLIEQSLRRGVPARDAVCEAMRQLEGSFAVGILLAGDPRRVFAARHGSPLVVGLGKMGNFIASDPLAVSRHAESVIYLEDGQVAEISSRAVTVVDLEGREVEVEPRPLTVDAEEAEKAGFETFMLKEIHEQPRVLWSMLERHTGEKGEIHIDFGRLDAEFLHRLERIMVVACGTAFYAGLYGKLFMEHLTDIAVEVDLGSEFRYRAPKFDRDTLIIAVSQSGETADTLASVRSARERGAPVFSICNVAMSTLARESDAVFYTAAGPEIGVASTKAFTVQLAALALFSLRVAEIRGELTAAQKAELLEGLRRVPQAIHRVLLSKEHIAEIAVKHHAGPSALYLGRRFNYPIALEGALKNKEISYQHAEGYAAGEMKHGPIALISEYMPVVCICTRTADNL
ncbi:MAG TPA: glutamine--fructose-6-phosphate transaminase (isomerizing), partial [Kiritimatiellae bacterium]|nr:glutamine--fructose-6-phosphate transaminase (isomerizing) [Kiritimatiellia bacterium]